MVITDFGNLKNLTNTYLNSNGKGKDNMNKKYKDIKGQIINGYEVIDIDHIDSSGHVIWECGCVKCGTSKLFSYYDLTHPGRKSFICKNCHGKPTNHNLTNFKLDTFKQVDDDVNYGDDDESDWSADYADEYNHKTNDTEDDVTEEEDSHSYIIKEVPNDKTAFNTYFNDRLEVNYIKNCDLFDCPIYYHIAHCIPDNLTFHGAIAKMNNYLFCLSDTIEENKQYWFRGGNDSELIKCGNCLYVNGVFNLIVTESKNHYSTSYQSLRSALVDMYKTAMDNKVKYIAMPKIGCGSNKLNWDAVYEIIVSSFGEFLDNFEEDIPECWDKLKLLIAVK